MEISKKDIDFLVSILKKYIDTSLATITNRGKIKLHYFEQEYMRTVNGGLPLDQSLFRTYLQTCGKANLWFDTDKTGLLPTNPDSDVLYILWKDGVYVMYIYTDKYEIINVEEVDPIFSSWKTSNDTYLTSILNTVPLDPSNKYLNALREWVTIEGIEETDPIFTAWKTLYDQYLTALLVESPDNPTTKYLNGLRQWVEIIDTGITELVESITWSNLKSRRDNSLLVPGMKYRITDYVTTTIQADTHSAGHQFDIIVEALDVNVLSEDAQAIQHDGDTYFSDSNLEAWELKYCLDNDKKRFAWAGDTQEFIKVFAQGNDPFFRDSSRDTIQENVQYYGWYNQQIDLVCFTLVEVPTPGIDLDYMYNEGTIELMGDGINVYTPQTLGKGVIYWMKDEFNNECPYDFKNIQFKRYPILTAPTELSNLIYDADDQKVKYGSKDIGGNVIPNNCTIDENNPSWYYTFTWGTEGFVEIVDLSIVGNTLKNDEGQISGIFGNVIKETTTCSYGLYEDGLERLTTCLNNNTFVSYYDWESGYFYGCSYNTFGNRCQSNTFGNDCHSNTFGNDCHSNTFGNRCQSNTFGYNCHSNTFGNGCQSNTFGYNCHSNTFGNGCYLNTFGYNCYSNTFGNDCYSNTFGNGCQLNTFGINCYSNTFGDYCAYVNFYSGASGNTPKDYVRYITLEDGVQYNNFYSNVTTSGSSYLQRIRIKGLVGTSGSPLATQINTTANNNFEWVIAKNTTGVVKQYCVEDLDANKTTKITDTVVSVWDSSTKYTGYLYQSTINIIDLKEEDSVEIAFGLESATSGNYAPICEQYEGYIIIFSKLNSTITIPTIVIHKIAL